MAKRVRPSVTDMEEGVEHSYDHRGDTGMYGNFLTEDVEEWFPNAAQHDVAIIMYLYEGDTNSIFRKAYPELNKPFTDKQLKNGSTWSHKLSVFVHRNVGANKDSIICPKTIKEPCPICEEQARLRDVMEDLKARNKNTDAIKECADALYPSKRAIYNILCFDSKKEQAKGVQVWIAPHPSIEDVLASKAKIKRTGEIIPFGLLEENLNVTFEKTGSGLKTEYNDVEIEDRLPEDELDDETIQELYDSTYDLDNIVEIKDYDSIAAMCKFGNGSNDDVEEEEVEEEEERPKSRRGRGGASRRRSTTEEEEEEEQPRSRRGSGSSSPRGRRAKEEPDEEQEEEEEKPKSSRRGSKRNKDEQDDEYPECFAKEFNTKDECEDTCPDGTYKACYEKTEQDKEEEKPKSTSRGKAGRTSRKGR